MKRVLAFAVAMSIAGCKCDEVLSCTLDGDCPSGAVCRESLCVKNIDGMGGGTGGGGDGGAGVGGGSGGGAGGGQSGLASIRWVSPDGGSTNAMTLPLRVDLQPTTFDAGLSLQYTLRSPTGSATSGNLQKMGPGVFGGAMTPMLSDGTWEAYVAVGGMDASVRFTVDRTPPAVALIVEAAPSRIVDGGFSEVDPAPGFDKAWRRDESAELKVLASEPVTVTAANISGVPAASLTAHACSVACDAGQCDCFGLDLAQVSIPDSGFRGDVQLTLSGVMDRAGNLSGASAPAVRVTRWKWKKLVVAGATSVHTPAIDTTGDLFVGAQVSANSGALVSLSATGAERFATSSFGAITAPPVVGKWLYLATRDSTGAVRQVDRSSGSFVNLACEDAARIYDAPMSLVDIAAADERIIAVAHNGAVAAARPTATINKCIETSVTGASPGRRYTVVSTDGHSFLGNNFNATLTRLSWNSSGLSWADAGTNSPTLFTEGLALFGTTLGGGGGLTTGGIFATKYDNANFSLPAPTTFTRDGGSAEATGPTVLGTVTAPTFVYGNGSDLSRVSYTPGDPGTFGAATTAVSPTTMSIATGALVGSGGEIYVADSAGTVTAYSSDLLTLKWRLPAGASGIAGGNVDSALNIDVARSGISKNCMKPGTLYVPSTGDGSLYAFIVDSKGIDATAPWPRFQHDPRNTANPGASLAEFSCP